MNMQALFFVPGTDGNPNAPVCSYCNRTEARHEPNDHVFDAVGGSLKAIDPRNGPPRLSRVEPKDTPQAWAGRARRIAAYAAMAWAGLFVLAILGLHALHLT